MTPDYGAASQLEKIAMLDYADIIALNKFDKQGALDALRDVKKQYQRNNTLFDQPADEMPVYGTIASQYNNEGVNILFEELAKTISKKTGYKFPKANEALKISHNNQQIVPPGKVRYLSEIADAVRNYNEYIEEKAQVANKLQAYVISESEFKNEQISKRIQELKDDLGKDNLHIIENWKDKKQRYKDEFYVYQVRGKDIKVETHVQSLSHSKIPKIALPNY